MLRVSRGARRFVALLGAFSLWRESARAQFARPQGVHVLDIDSDDADEQADALTGALRARVRLSPGWLLLDATQSLAMLTAALRCPQRPDAACLQRIADLLKSDRFIWGVLSRPTDTPHFVTAEVHFWSRGRPDVTVKESYSDNLKDPSDDALRTIANRVFDGLTRGAGSAVSIHAGAVDGVVLVDGQPSGALKNGWATLLLSVGAHVIEVRASGFVPARQDVVAIAGERKEVDVPMQTELASPVPSFDGSPRRSSHRTRAELGTLISGGILLAAGGALAVVFESERSTLNADRANNYGFENSVKTITDPCSIPAGENSPQVSGGCTAHNVAQAVLIPEIASLGLGGILVTVGAVLLATDHRSEPKSTDETTGSNPVALLPGVGPHEISLWLSRSF
jgi:hypothetical protein